MRTHRFNSINHGFMNGHLSHLLKYVPFSFITHCGKRVLNWKEQCFDCFIKKNYFIGKYRIQLVLQLNITFLSCDGCNSNGIFPGDSSIKFKDNVITIFLDVLQYSSIISVPPQIQSKLLSGSQIDENLLSLIPVPHN